MESEKPSTGRWPIWIPIVHVAQVFLSLIILGLSGYLIHGKYFNTLGFDIFASLLTWLVVAYLLITAYISSLHNLTHIFIVIAANALLVLFWLAAMGATASLRSSFKYNVNIYGCYDDGSSIDSTTCLVGRDLEKRAAVATKLGLSMMSAIAGLSALVMLLFIATLVHAIMRWYKSRSTITAVAHAPQKQEQQAEGYQMATPQGQPQYAAAAQQQQQQQQYAPPAQPYYPPPQQAYSPPPQQTYSPPPQVFTPPPQQGYGHDQQQQHQQYVQPQHTGSSMPGPPQGGQSELYTPPHQQSELPSPVYK
ncbi:hypothetical protein BKA65DRAFT_283466 [Rhexocercosporidium sp. MPI-PUGE-AT-0058]|nr:hypothetical protein BKA65DRAFT_283466 [Rhexocercosporidium sp. MPI-PUGE-AT-0058]